MSEEQQRFGDGQDNYLQGAQKGMQAAKQAAAVGKTAEAGANAAAATVQGSVETGKAAANIAAGAAAGGPWGAILSAAWAMRNTLFKIVVFLCLFLSVLIVLIVSLPSIVTNNVFRTDPATVDLNAPTDLVGNPVKNHFHSFGMGSIYQFFQVFFCSVTCIQLFIILYTIR